MKTRIKKWGNSSGVRIPAPMLRVAQFGLGDPVNVRAEAGRVVIAAPRRKACDLDELVSRITSKNRHSPIDAVPDVGNEVSLRRQVPANLKHADLIFLRSIIEGRLGSF